MSGDHGVGADGGAPADGTSTSGPLHHVLSTGQSNSIGFASTPPLTIEQSFSNVMFDTGVMTAKSCDDKGCPRGNLRDSDEEVPSANGYALQNWAVHFEIPIR